MKYNFIFFDLWPYIILAIVFCYSYLNNNKYSSLNIFLWLFIFSALRYDVGWDYTAYAEKIIANYVNYENYDYEPLSNLILSLGSYLKFYPIVFILYAFLTLVIILIVINKYSTNYILSWAIYYSMPLFYFASLSTLRQSLALALIFYSFHFLATKRFVHYLVSVLLASTIHISAIAGFFILPLFIFPIGRVINIILFFSSFFISEYLRSILNEKIPDFGTFEKLTVYLNTESYKSTILPYFYYLIGFVNLLFYNKLSKINPLNTKFITLSTFGLVCYNLLSFEPVSADRISAFFLIFWILILPSYSDLFNPKNARLFNVFMLLFFLSISFIYLYIYISAYSTGFLPKAGFLPYKIWFNHLDNY